MAVHKLQILHDQINRKEFRCPNSKAATMKSIPRIPITFNARTFLGLTGVTAPIPSRRIHSSAAKAAVAHPINVRGPPPKPPAPSPEFVERIERRKKQADLIQQGNVADSGQGSASSKPLKRRFWKDVHVKEVDGKKDKHPFCFLEHKSGA